MERRYNKASKRGGIYVWHKYRNILIVLCLWLCLLETPKALYTTSTPMKCVLDKVEEAVSLYQSEVDVKDCRLSISEMKNYFWDGAVGYPFRELIQSFTYRYATSYVDSLTIQYRYTKDSTIQIQQNYQKIKDELLLSLDQSMSTLDKMFYLYNYLILESEYDTDAASIQDSFQSAQYALSFSLFGPLYYGKAVCSGYSQSYLDLLNELGIETRYLTSQKMNHGWNIVKYNNQWYHVDVTYGDPIPDLKGFVDYKYFMMNDQEIASDHSWEDHSITSTSTLLSGSKYIFNQDIEDANYAYGKWYYVENGNIYSSTIDSLNKELVLDLGTIKDLFIDGNKMYYTTTNDGYYINAIYETTLNLDYTVLLTSLKSSTYIEGLFVEEGKAYVNTKGHDVHYFDVSSNASLESYLDSFNVENEAIYGQIVLTIQYYNTLFDPSKKAELLLKGSKYTVGIPLTKIGSSLYQFTLPIADLFNDTYTLEIEYDGKKYPMSAVLGEKIEYQNEEEIHVVYEAGKLSVEGVQDREEELDLSAYSLRNMDVYEGSRVTSIASKKDGFTVAGYMFEKEADCNKKDSVWREIVFVNEHNLDPAFAYRKQVTSVYKTWLNENSNATVNGKYRLDFAEYTVDFEETTMNNYKENKPTMQMLPGSYLVYMRISNGETSQLFPLMDKTLSDGTNMENTGTLPDGFEVIDSELRTLRYIVK